MYRANLTFHIILNNPTRFKVVGNWEFFFGGLVNVQLITDFHVGPV
jgi:hypothetical protein